MTYINETGVDVIRSVNSKNEWQLHSRSFNWKKQQYDNFSNHWMKKNLT
jgi:hypothetical protein